MVSPEPDTTGIDDYISDEDMQLNAEVSEDGCMFAGRFYSAGAEVCIGGTYHVCEPFHASTSERAFAWRDTGRSCRDDDLDG